MENSKQVKPSFIKDLKDASGQNKPPTMLDAPIWDVDVADFRQALYQGCTAVNAFPTSLSKPDQAVLLASTEEVNKRHRQEFLNNLDQDTAGQLSKIKDRALENLKALLKVNSALKSCKQGGTVAAFLEAQELGYKLTSPVERTYAPVPYLEACYVATLNTGMPKIIALEMTSMLIGHRWRRACICYYFLEHFGEFEEVFQRYTPERIPVSRYASKPYQELLKYGQNKVLIGLYDATHADLPALETDLDEERFLLNQNEWWVNNSHEICQHRQTLSVEAKHWVEQKREAVERAYREKSTKTLEQIMQPELAPDGALKELWFSLIGQELSFMLDRLPSLSFLTKADNTPFQLAQAPQDDLHQAFYELAHNTVLEHQDSHQRSAIFQEEREQVSIDGKGWIALDEEDNSRLIDWLEGTLERLNRNAEKPGTRTIREIVISNMPYIPGPITCLMALWLRVLFKDDVAMLKRLRLISDPALPENAVASTVTLPASQSVNSNQPLNPDSQVQTPQPAPQANEAVKECREEKYPFVTIDKDYDGKFVLVDGVRLYDGVSGPSKTLLQITQICKVAQQRGKSYREFNKYNSFNSRHVEKINAEYREKLGRAGQLIKTTKETILPLFDI